MDRRRRSLGHDTRVVLLAWMVGLPGGTLALALLWSGPWSGRTQTVLTILLLVVWGGLALALRGQVVRPLGTLANMLAALREGDYSIRARVLDGHDPLSLVFLELNALEDMLRDQRLGAVEATETLRKVLEEIDVAVFAFDPGGTLRIVNRAGERLLGQPAERLIGRSAVELRLDDTMTGIAPRTLEVVFPGGSGRWELRRSVVRQEGSRLQLVALSDLSRALREEERQAWKRIIRVLSHEINNSLAPIKSISGSLRSVLGRSGDVPPDLREDLERGLGIISSRAESLGRFMASYARLARLPKPKLVPVDIAALVRGVADLETRHRVEIVSGPEVTIHADPDQLEQVFINLLRNAVDATLDRDPGGRVTMRWLSRNGRVHVLVEDEGPGIADTGNLFVPFYTTKPGGSGIGLVLSRQIVEAHGGTLHLEPRGTHAGARARIVLPIDPTA